MWSNKGNNFITDLSRSLFLYLLHNKRQTKFIISIDVTYNRGEYYMY